MITAATATDVCFVHVLDDTERSLTLAGATPPFDAQVGKIRLPLDTGVSGWVASHREPVVITGDKESDPRYIAIPSRCAVEHFTSMVSVPMETEPGGLVGVLNVHTVAHREFDDRDVELLPSIGRLSPGRCTRRGCTAGSWPASEAHGTVRRAGHRTRRRPSGGGWPATSTTASPSGW